MRKIISLILAVLMVSMMIPAMALAEESATTAVDYAGLVAGETFTVKVEGVASTTVKIAVNSQLFSIDGVTAVDSIASKDVDVVDGTATLEVKVNAEVPAVVESSKIQITDGSEIIEQFAAIADRKIGDVDGSGVIDSYDAAQLLAYAVGASASVDATFKPEVANVDGSDAIDSYDAAQLLAYSVGASASVDVSTSALVNTFAGGNATFEVVDPFGGTDTPAEPTALATPANIYAYAQNGKIYYTFDAVEGAEGYSIAVSTLTDAVVVTDATGSFDCAYTADMTITVTATTTADGFTNSAASEAVTVIEADASGALAEWLTENGLEDVAITVHEIK